MSGKLTVIGMLLLGLAALLYGLYFVSDNTPVSERFDMKRTSLAANAPGPSILLEQFANFHRQSFEPLAEGADQQLHAQAVYHELDDRQVVLNVEQPREGAQAKLDALIAELNAQDPLILAAHPKAVVPYAYTVRNLEQTGTGAKVSHHEFIWVNGAWLFSVYTEQADAEALLRFVNNYPY